MLFRPELSPWDELIWEDGTVPLPECDLGTAFYSIIDRPLRLAHGHGQGWHAICLMDRTRMSSRLGFERSDAVESVVGPNSHGMPKDIGNARAILCALFPRQHSRNLKHSRCER